MSTDEMLIEISSYQYECYGFPYVFLTYTFNFWEVVWRNPIEPLNTNDIKSKTPNEACKKAIEFIKNNPKWFTKNLKSAN